MDALSQGLSLSLISAAGKLGSTAVRPGHGACSVCSCASLKPQNFSGYQVSFGAFGWPKVKDQLLIPRISVAEKLLSEITESFWLKNLYLS